MSEMPSMDDQVTIHLSFAEALILSHYLHRLASADNTTLSFDKAEQVAIWNLEATLERWNPIIFSEDYLEHLQDAKSFITRGMDE